MKKLILLSAVFFLHTLPSKAQIVFHEDFNSPSSGDSVTTIFNGIHGFAQNSRLGLFAGDFCDSAYIDVGDTIILETQAFNTVGLNNCYLFFKHICKVDFFDLCMVEVSPDNGATWFQLGPEYITNIIFPPGSPFPQQGYQFSAASYPVWQPGIAMAIPNLTWWVKEGFNLSLIVNSSQAKIRWRMFDSNIPGGNGNSGWSIDDIVVGDTIIYGPTSYTLNNPIYCSLPAQVPFGLSIPATGFTNQDTLNCQLYFGDGSNTFFNLTGTSTGFFSGSTIFHSYLLPGIYYPYAVLNFSTGFSTTIYGNSVLVGNSCDTLSGYMYFDNNSDCQFNTGDDTLRNQRVHIYENGNFIRYAFSDYNGYYNAGLINGITYEVAPPPFVAANLNAVLTCPASGNYIVSSLPSTGNEFGFECIPGVDFYAWTNLNCVRMAVPVTSNAIFRNILCEKVPSVAKIVKDPNLNFQLLNPQPTLISGDTFIWVLPPMNYGSNLFIVNMTISINTSMSVGDSVYYYQSIESLSNELSPLDNVISRWLRVVTSWDPNDKQVFPDGNISPSQELTYMIRFQNTGNDTAFNISVVDTLSQSLDVSTLEIMGASHPMSIDVVTSHVLKFNFYNIMLPDSGTNEPESHGFILYKIKPLHGLPNGTFIENKAHIFFDWNPAIVTNTTITVIDSALATAVNPVSSTASTFNLNPNPAKEEVTVLIPAFAEGEYQYDISDAMGKSVQKGDIISSRQIVSLQTFANGVYYFRLSGKITGVSVKKMVVVRE